MDLTGRTEEKKFKREVMMIETRRRKFLRFNLPLRSEIITGPSSIPGSVVDFSRGGLRLRLEAGSLEIGSVVKVRLWPPEKEEPVILSGEVRWKRLIEDIYEAGLEFRSIDSSQKADILDYAYNRWLKEIKSQVN